MSGITVSARIGAMIVRAAAAAGADASRLQATTGFDAALAADPDARIPLELESRLWDEAASLTGDAAFGLHAARGLQPGVFDVLDYACRTAPTLRVAFERLARYNGLEHDDAVFTSVALGEVSRLEHRFRTPGVEPSRHAAEFTLAGVVVIGGQIAGVPLRPRKVELRHPQPGLAAAYQDLFACQPTFGHDANALEFDAVILDRPAPKADPALWRIIERQADALLAARPSPSVSTTDRVRRLLVETMGEGDTSLGTVAGRLKMSERSLQRRLTDEGATFDTLVEDLRRQLALRYLSDSKLAIGEVAYLLGYSEPSAFHRAFKRWTGRTPKEARAAVA